MSQEPTAHARLGASSSEIWMNCPGAPSLWAKLPKKTASRSMLLGTAAHALGEQCLRNGLDPFDMIGKTVKAEGETFPVDEDMAGAVDVYTAHVRGQLKRLKGATLNIERKFSLAWLDEDLFGTNDSSVVQPFGVCHVVDYKHGAGKYVHVSQNSQLLYYAVGAVFGDNGVNADLIEDIEYVIVQPRCPAKSPIREDRITASELWAWAHDVLKPAAVATRRPDAPCKSGDWCGFCNAQAICPALRKTAFAAAELVFKDDLPAPTDKIVLPAPATMTPAQIGKVLEAAQTIADWAEAVYAYGLAEVEAGRMAVPGWKVVKGDARRAWKDEAEALAKLEKLLGAEGAKTQPEPKLLSPAQAEKAVKAAGLAPAIELKGLIVKPEGASKLVHEDDPRPSVDVKSLAEEVFK